MTFFNTETLPDELWLGIFRFSSSNDIRQLSAVSKHMCRLGEDNLLWKHITQQMFSHIPESPFLPSCWRERFKILSQGNLSPFSTCQKPEVRELCKGASVMGANFNSDNIVTVNKNGIVKVFDLASRTPRFSRALCIASRILESTASSSLLLLKFANPNVLHEGQTVDIWDIRRNTKIFSKKTAVNHPITFIYKDLYIEYSNSKVKVFRNHCNDPIFTYSTNTTPQLAESFLITSCKYLDLRSMQFTYFPRKYRYNSKGTHNPKNVIKLANDELEVIYFDLSTGKKLPFKNNVIIAGKVECVIGNIAVVNKGNSFSIYNYSDGKEFKNEPITNPVQNVLIKTILFRTEHLFISTSKGSVHLYDLLRFNFIRIIVPNLETLHDFYVIDRSLVLISKDRDIVEYKFKAPLLDKAPVENAASVLKLLD